MSTQQEQTEVIRFRASKALVSRIDRAAKRNFVKRSEIVRRAIAEFIERTEVAA